MRALRMVEFQRDPELMEIPEPVPGPGEVVVKVGAAGACHSDLHVLYEMDVSAVWQLPMTLGHEDLMRRSSRMFGKLILAVAVGHHKRTMFSIDERLDMAREIVKQYPNVVVMPFSGLLRDFVVGNNGNVVVRGVRGVTDFDYEFQMAGMNRQLMPEVETMFLLPSDQHQFVSGTFVREIATLGGDVSKLVAPLVLERLKERVARPPQET